MLHLVIPVGPLQCNCSILADEAAGEAIVVDPGANIDDLLRLLRQRNLTVKHIIITHGHIDHIGGAELLRAATGAAVYMNHGDEQQMKLLDLQAAWIGMQSPGPITIDQPLRDGDVLKAGKISISAVHTPGHTEGSTSLYIPAEKKLLAGDTLFAGSVGRTDLPGGDFEKLMSSLQTTLMSLPDDVEVTPGHGPSTTSGEERETNPFIADDRFKPRIQQS